MLTEKQLKQIREELDSCKRPLIFFHDDADGLCSFLLFYRRLKEGKGVIVKTTPRIDKKFLTIVEEYGPDKIFVVDIAIVEQEFIDKVKQKIVWIDHHPPLERENIDYYNPRIGNPDDNIPASEICYDVVQDDLWIAMIGVISDWHWPAFAEEFRDAYPDLLPEKINEPEEALFESPLGKLIEIISFALKGSTKEAMQSAKIMTRISSPYEILNQESPAGKFLYKKYSSLKNKYDTLLKKALEQKAKGKILLFRYPHDQFSFTKDLANELLHRSPDKIILIAREKGNEMKMSLRSKKEILPPLLEKALEGLEGYGGGHEHACGASVKINDFEQFVKQLEEQLE